MKKVIIVFVIGLVFLPFAKVSADTLDQLSETVDETLDLLDLTDIESVTAEVIDDFYGKIQQIINGNFDDINSVWQMFWQLLYSSLTEISASVISVGIVIIILGLVKNSSDGLIGKNTQSVIRLVGISVVVTAIAKLLIGIYGEVFQLMDKFSALSHASFPIILTLLVANGGNAVSSVCQPSMVMFSSVIVELIRNVILPLSIISIIFIAVGCISHNIKLDKTSTTLQGISKWLLSIVFMFFSAFTSIQGIAASNIDTISFRAAKFAAKNYVPILGGYLAEGFDMVVASTTLVKNSFGIVCMIAIFLLIVKPVVTILITNLSLQILGSVCQPIVDEAYINIFTKVGKSLSFLAILIVAVAFMFCILLFISICCCNMV